MLYNLSSIVENVKHATGSRGVVESIFRGKKLPHEK